MLIKILVIDDEILMRELLRRFLGDYASKIMEAEDLELGLGLARIEHPHLVILDLKLRLTGKTEALRAIREFKSYGSEVIVVSGIAEPDLKDECMAAGAASFLSKGSDFTSHALMVAAHVATTKLPMSAYKDESFLKHVELLRNAIKANTNH